MFDQGYYNYFILRTNTETIDLLVKGANGAKCSFGISSAYA